VSIRVIINVSFVTSQGQPGHDAEMMRRLLLKYYEEDASNTFYPKDWKFYLDVCLFIKPGINLCLS